MSEYITDVAKWDNYSFLNKVWNIYMEFDNTVEGDNNKNTYEGVCEGIVKTYGKEKDNHKDFCMKLVRNLGCYNSGPKYYNPNSDRCHILYNWIYNEKNKYNKSDDVITQCFDDYIRLMDRTDDKHKCSFVSYNAIYEDAIKMTILDIFNDNMSYIRDKLMEEHEKDNFSPENFVCKCVKIYKEMYLNYCNDTYSRKTKHKSTCDKLDSLKTIYKQYLFDIGDLKNKIPSLDDNLGDFWDKCKQGEILLAISVLAVPEVPKLQLLDVDSEEDTNEAMPYGVDSAGNNASPMSRTISTTVGTVAGASSVLALLYKVNEEFHLNFSPARRLLHSGFRGNTGRMNSNFYEDGPTELLIDGFQGEDMSSYNPSYNIGYGSV